MVGWLWSIGLAWGAPPWAVPGAELAVPGEDLASVDGRTALVIDRLAAVLPRAGGVPRSLDEELHGAFADVLAVFGEPDQTIDWLHLLAAAGGDPAAVLRRLSLDEDTHYTVVLDEDAILRGPDTRKVVPLLGHRSVIVRTRAALRLEEDPQVGIAALARAWRFAPGRVAPLRGVVGIPELPRTEANATTWERTLVRWTRRSSRQNDDNGMIATLWFVASPATTTALTDLGRQDLAQGLLKTARRDRSPIRQQNLLQAVDAVLRGVPLDEGTTPAPEEVAVTVESWRRMTPP
ncbi:MAG: hypothetical protein ABMB14_35115 [Myxococcota bacterium]